MARSFASGLRPVHPGEILREDVRPALGRPKTEIARLLGISRQTLYDILNEKQPITAHMALRIGKLCGNGAEIRVNMQRRYDLKIAEAELGDALDAIPLLRAA
jgi:antitoxin HigA-1